jgi:ubiquinone/menaquinone biosynthesis C-methylase UbiE
MERITDSFTQVADDYAAYRPGYPDILFDRIQELSPALPDSVVLDVGAGTGNATRRLGQVYASAIGVEPSDGMREQARRMGGDYVAGTAEALPFRDGSVQVITAAQCIHWFDVTRFCVEAARTLVPCGIVVAFGEGPAPDAPFRPAVHRVVDQYLKDHEIVEPSRSPSFGVKATNALADAGFVDVRTEVFDHEVEWDIPRFVGFMQSWSRMAHFSKDQLAEIAALAAMCLEDRAGGETFSESCRTHAIIGRRE